MRILLLLPFLALCHAIAQPLRFEIIPGGVENRCQFEVRSPVETSQGVTHEATGYVAIDPTTSDTGQGLITVPAASFTTGSGWRDRLMKGKYLEVEKYPEITFEITRIVLDTVLLPGQRTPADVAGLYSLHGQTHEIKPTTYLTFAATDSGMALRIEAEFETTLSDYGIKVPRVLFFKGADYQKVTVDITAIPPDSTRD